MDYKDAIEFIMAGATAIQVGTANFINPQVMPEIIRDMEKFMEEQNIKSLDEIRGIIYRRRKMTDVEKILKDCGAFLQGHFLLSSGKHSDGYVQCAKVLMHLTKI